MTLGTWPRAEGGGEEELVNTEPLSFTPRQDGTFSRQVKQDEGEDLYNCPSGSPWLQIRGVRELVAPAGALALVPTPRGVLHPFTDKESGSRRAGLPSAQGGDCGGQSRLRSEAGAPGLAADLRGHRWGWGLETGPTFLCR